MFFFLAPWAPSAFSYPAKFELVNFNFGYDMAFDPGFIMRERFPSVNFFTNAIGDVGLRHHESSLHALELAASGGGTYYFTVSDKKRLRFFVRPSSIPLGELSKEFAEYLTLCSERLRPDAGQKEIRALFLFGLGSVGDDEWHMKFAKASAAAKNMKADFMSDTRCRVGNEIPSTNFGYFSVQSLVEKMLGIPLTLPHHERQITSQQFADFQNIFHEFLFREGGVYLRYISRVIVGELMDSWQQKLLNKALMTAFIEGSNTGSVLDLAAAMFIAKKQPIELLSRMAEYCNESASERQIDWLTQPIALENCLAERKLSFVTTKVGDQVLVLTMKKADAF